MKSAKAELVTSDVSYPGKVAAGGPVFLLRDTGQEAFLAARVRLARFRVEAAETAFTAGGVSYPPGSWILPAAEGLRAELEAVARDLGLDFAAVASAPPSRHTRSTSRASASSRPGATRRGRAGSGWCSTRRRSRTRFSPTTK